MEKKPYLLRIGFKILDWFCSIDHIEIVKGDLTELYWDRVQKRGTTAASWAFIKETIDLTTRYFVKGKSNYYSNNIAMLKNYFLIGIRNLLKNRSYSIINILGLALGLSGAILIYQYITFERAFDRQFTKHDQIVRVTSEWFQDNEFLEHRAAAVPALEQIFDSSFPEVLEFTRYHKGAPNVVRFISDDNKETKFEETNIYYADPGFLSIFEIEFVAGNPSTSLIGPNKVIVTEDIARKYFGDDNPIGKTLKFDGEFDFSCQVTGVIKEIDQNSHLAGNMIISLDTKVNLVPFEIYDNWIWRSFYTYLVVDPQTDISELETEINSRVKQKIDDYYEQRRYAVNFHVQRLTDIHLHSDLFEEIEVNGNAQTVGYLTLACIFLLAIAGFNYINLTTAKNLYRAKEVGIRKVVGAVRINLTLQYLIESLLIFSLAIAVSLGAIYLSFPYLNSFFQLHISADFLSGSKFWVFILLVWFIGGLAAGLYPAFVLTAMKPTVVLKGSFKNTTGTLILRKSLVVFQIALSLGLVISVIIISHQVQHMRGRDLGVKKENLLVINGPKIKDERYHTLLETFKQQLELQPTIESVSTVSSLIGEVTGAGRDFTNEEGKSQFLRIIRVDYDFDKALDIATVAGATFSKAIPAADSGLVLNQAAVRQMGFPNEEAAIQSSITWRNIRETIQSKVVGVVKDYHPSAQSEAVPTVFILNRFYSAPWDPEYYVVSLNTSDFQETVSEIRNIESTWAETYPADPINYYFMEEFYDKQFKSEIAFGRILMVFSWLAITLSFIGIVALASFSNYMRQKEMGIRKVLGSSERGILTMLLGDYIKMVLAGAILTIPLVYYVFSAWLSTFNYRIEMQLWHFLTPVAALLTLVLIIISLQSYKVVRLNPVHVLRSE